MSQETPTRVAALKRGASHRPAGTFLAVFVTYSALVATVSYRTGRNSSGSEDIVYAWGPMISAGCWMRAFVTGSDNSGTHGFVVTLFLAGTLEELGWRGFLQPHLQQRFDAVWVSIGIGVTWAVWHIPMMVAGFGDFAAFWEYTLNITAISIVYGWLYNTTDAALPVVMITHAAHNIPPISTSTGTVPTIFTTVSGDTMIYITCALLVTLYAGSRTLTRDGTLPGIPGQPRGRSPGSGTSAD